MLQLLRWQARWIRRQLGGEEQMMLGAACTDVGVALHLAGPFMAGTLIEQFIFQMSAFAILATGLTFVAAGQALIEVEQQPEQSSAAGQDLTDQEG